MTGGCNERPTFILGFIHSYNRRHWKCVLVSHINRGSMTPVSPDTPLEGIDNADSRGAARRTSPCRSGLS